MSFVPVIAGAGVGAWSFLQRTGAAQKAALLRSPQMQRDETYFRANIAKVRTAGDLLADRRLLSVALTAYGLEGDVANKAFLRRVLTDGTISAQALAKRLSDKRYLEFARAFGFGNFAMPNTAQSDFADTVLSRFEARTFEAAVGAQDQDLRLALNAGDELGAISGKSLSQNGKWYLILGSPPLRKLVQTAFGLPGSFSGFDLDRQLSDLKAASLRALGTSDPARFDIKDKGEELIRLFLSRADAAGATPSGQSTALTLLRRNAGLSRYV